MSNFFVQPYNLEELFPEAPPAALDLLTRFLAFDPANRITVQEALRHEYFEVSLFTGVSACPRVFHGVRTA